MEEVDAAIGFGEEGPPPPGILLLLGELSLSKMVLLSFSARDFLAFVGVC